MLRPKPSTTAWLNSLLVPRKSALAWPKKWDVSSDGLTYTFTLRKGVKFHTTPYFKPGRDFNADDVVFTFSRFTNKDLPFNKATNATYPYASDMGMDTNITKVEKVDPYTVKMTLKTVDAAFLQNLAMSFSSIVSAEYADQLLKANKADQINTQPIGTGPFVFNAYQKDSVIRYSANPDYWRKGEVKIDKLIFLRSPPTRRCVIRNCKRASARSWRSRARPI